MALAVPADFFEVRAGDGRGGVNDSRGVPGIVIVDRLLGKSTEAATVKFAMTVAVVAVVTACSIAPSASPATPSPLATPAPASSLTLRTHDDAPGGPCMAALAAGQLVSDERTGIALGQRDRTVPIIWPRGYSGRMEGDRLALVDARGRVLAYVGDGVEMGGGYLRNDTAFRVCGDVEVVAAGP